MPLSPLSFARLWRMRMAPGFIDGVHRRSVGLPWCRLKRSICSRDSRRLSNVRCAFLEIVGDRLPDRLGALAPLVELGLEVALGLLEFGLQRLKLGLQRRNLGVVLHTFLVIR